jgi:hypothetical protein
MWVVNYYNLPFMNLFYYARRFGYNALPPLFFKFNYDRLKRFEKECNKQELNNRLNYYFKINSQFEIPSAAIAVKNFRLTKGSNYYLDLKEFLHYFSRETRFAYHFGDETHINSFPTLFKARPICGENKNSVLFKLNKRRHFQWVDDPYSFAEKRDMLVWRGGAYQQNRKNFVRSFWNHPLCEVGQTNKPVENVPWQKSYLPVEEQLKYKFIFCPEGNDVATNLKWVMSSNSLCLMPKPKYETWFMEGRLVAGAHYVEINEDFSNLEDSIAYYSEHIKEARQITDNAHRHVAKFLNEDFEDLLCLKVLERYVELSNQQNLTTRFGLFYQMAN